jgi:hypothetical protein
VVGFIPRQPLAALWRLWYTSDMETSNLQLTPELRKAIAERPDEPLYIEDAQSQKTYLLLETGKFPELEEEYVRARLEEGFAAIERGEEEEWDSASIKADGRRILQERQSQQ